MNRFVYTLEKWGLVDNEPQNEPLFVVRVETSLHPANSYLGQHVRARDGVVEYLEL